MHSLSSRTRPVRACMWAMPRSYTALDIVARKKRMQGYNVLYPDGLGRIRSAD